jgi:hypothetical protein
MGWNDAVPIDCREDCKCFNSITEAVQFINDGKASGVEAERGGCATDQRPIPVQVGDQQTIKDGKATDARTSGFDSIQEAVQFINDCKADGVEAERGACPTAERPSPQRVEDGQTIEDGKTTARAGGVDADVTQRGERKKLQTGASDRSKGSRRKCCTHRWK